MLVGNGFDSATPGEMPNGMKCWHSASFSPLWKGRASFQVSARANPDGMGIDLFYYQGRVSANKALVEAIIACVRRDAPSATVKLKAETELFPSWLKE